MTASTTPTHISFTNPGEIDPRAFTLLGLSAKETTSPIGQFGTGLKYAIAITLRLGGTITIWSGLTPYNFSTKPGSFRGQEIVELTYNSAPLPFTLEYGKGWEPWQVIRELESNVRDEDGSSNFGQAQPAAGQTTIWLTGKPFIDAYADLNSYFISQRTVLAEDKDKLGYAHIHRKTTAYADRIYFRGVAVGVTTKPAIFTYDFHSCLSLTEDRALTYWCQSSIPAYLCQTIMLCQDPSTIEAFLTSSQETLEGSCVFASGSLTGFSKNAYKTFYFVIAHYIETGRAALLNPSALRNYYQTFELLDSLYEAYTPTAREKEMFVEAQLLVGTLFDGKLAPFKLVSSLPKNALGMVYAGNIYISKDCFSMGLETLVGTLFEEYCHFYLKHEDESRSFQNYLINTIARLASELDYERNSK